MCRGRGFLALQIIREECKAHDDCKQCDFYAGDNSHSMCLFDSPLLVKAIELDRLPNIKKDIGDKVVIIRDGREEAAIDKE